MYSMFSSATRDGEIRVFSIGVKPSESLVNDKSARRKTGEQAGPSTLLAIVSTLWSPSKKAYKIQSQFLHLLPQKYNMEG